MGYLAEWHHEMALRSGFDVDPMMTVLRDGGSYQVRGKLAGYLARLKATGRAHLAEELTRKHPHEL